MMRLVMVRWIDSIGTLHAWTTKDEYKSHKPCDCVSVGHLKTEVPGPDGHLELIQSVADEDDELEQYTNGIVIPNCAVKEMHFLEIEKVDS